MKRKKYKVLCQRVDTAEVIAPDDLISRYLPGDYHDTYEFCTPEVKGLSAMALLRTMWAAPPKAVSVLLTLRDQLVKPFGLQDSKLRTEPQWLADAAQQSRKTLEEASEEVLLCRDDRHLAFQVALKVSQKERMPTRVLATTAVQFHNRLGWLYFQAIRLMHGQVVCLTLKHSIGALLAKQEENG